MSSFLSILWSIACQPEPPETSVGTVSVQEHQPAAFTSERGGFVAVREPALSELRPAEDPWRNTPLGGGVLDLDQDGWLDVVTLSSPGGPVVWVPGGPDGLGVGQALPADLEPLGSLFSLESCDVDGDGGPELILAGTEGLGIFGLEGDSLTPWDHGVELKSGVSHLHVACRDYDRDGTLDLWVSGFGQDHGFFKPESVYSDAPEVNVSGARNSLWLGNRQGRFTRGGGALEAHRGATLHSLWFWLDGRPWLLESIDHHYNNLRHEDSRPSRIYAFEDEAWVLAWELPAQVEAPMGAARVDWQGEPRLVLSDFGQPSVETLVLEGDTLQSYASAASLGCMTDCESGGVSGVSWSVVGVDLAGDGDQDLLLSVGNLSAAQDQLADEQGHLFRPDQRTRLYRESACAESDYLSIQDEPIEAESRGMATGDLNRDGLMDVVVFNTNAAPHVLYGQDTGASRLVLALEDAGSNNRAGLGARISVDLGDGEVRLATLDPAGQGTFSTSAPELHFGLGTHQEIQAITVLTADGRSVTFDGPFPAHARLTLRLPD